MGKRVMLTANGFFVIVRHFRISLRRSSGVGWVSAVSYKREVSSASRRWTVPEILTMPRPPALDTADASSAYPTHCIPPWTTGTVTRSA